MTSRWPRVYTPRLLLQSSLSLLCAHLARGVQVADPLDRRPRVQLAAPGLAVNGGPAGSLGPGRPLALIRVAGTGLSMAGPTALLIHLES